MAEFEFKQIKKPKAKDGTIIVGLPGFGLVGRLVAEYIVGDLKMEEIAEIRSDFFPPQILTDGNSTVHELVDKIYHKKINDKDIFVLIGDAQPALPPQGNYAAQHSFSRNLAKTFKKLGITTIFTMAGMPTQERLYNGTAVSIVATDTDVFKKIKGKDYLKHPAGLPINGAAGLVLQYGKQQGLSGACLIGYIVDGEMTYPDFGAAYAILKILNRNLRLKLQMKRFYKSAKAFEDRLREIAKANQQQTELPDLHPSYIR